MKESLFFIPGVGSNHTLWEHQLRHLEDLVDVQVKVLYHEGGRAESVTNLLKRRSGSIRFGRTFLWRMDGTSGGC